MAFERLIQLGRVVLTNDNKLAIIVDIVNQNSVILAGRCNGVKRAEYRVGEFTMTKQVVTIARCAREAAVDAALAPVNTSFAASAWGKKIARRATKQTESDFDRFVTMCKK